MIQAGISMDTLIGMAFSGLVTACLATWCLRATGPVGYVVAWNLDLDVNPLSWLHGTYPEDELNVEWNVQFGTIREKK
jgi:hypothetical protein